MAASKRPAALVFLLSIWLLFSAMIPFSAAGQQDSASVNRKKLRTVAIASAVGYTAGVATLNYVWYKNTERQPFRFFNDNAEWKQLDKAGHFFNSYYLSDVTSRILRSCRLPQKKADMIGAFSGFLLTIPIEVMDGFSSGYGASAGDVIADAAGPVFFLGQKLLWNETRIIPRASFHRTSYAPRHPKLLGENLLSEVVKDYNGQTYWFSFDMDKFTRFPQWLNIAVGYGAEGMIHARDHQNEAIGLNPYRQYYIAVDFDLSAIRTRSKFVRTLLYIASTVRLPAPALEISSHGSRFYPFYF